MESAIWMYHPEHGARLFQSADELDAAGDGWTDTPADHAPRATGLSHQTDTAWQERAQAIAVAEARLTEWAAQLQTKQGELDAREADLAGRESTMATREAALSATGGETEAHDREALKARATELGIDFPRNITTEKLAELVAAHA